MDYWKVVDRIRELGESGKNKIMVTGPQRSGTTVATKMLAQDLGYACILEESFEYRNLAKMVNIINKRDRFVLQAPTMASICHYLPVVVVFMHRSVSDILKSQDRIKWEYDEREKVRYFTDIDVPVAQIKYDVWQEYQKPFIAERAFDLDYDSMEGHELWIDRKERRGFKRRQTTRSVESEVFHPDKIMLL